MKKRLLEGIKVLDFTSKVSGPTGTQILADLGAEVVKVELPNAGDNLRYWPPHYTPERSGFFINLNRNKKSITLDLKNPKSAEVMKKLIQGADAIMENMAPGGMARLGIGYEQVKQIKPDIVYASISGFGQDGPFKDYNAFDIVAEAMSGLMSINGQPDGPPTKVGVDISDMVSGIYAALGIIVSLYNRNKTGEGQYIDVALLDCNISLLEQLIQAADVSGVAPKRMGSETTTGSPLNAYETKDGYIVLASGLPKHFGLLCDICGKPEFKTDPRFKDMIGKNIHRDAVNKMVRDWAIQHTTDEACEILKKDEIPSGPVLNILEMFEHPQVKHRGSVVEFVDPVINQKVKVHALPMRFSDADVSVYKTAPLLGEDNEEIYCTQLGYTKEEYTEMKNEGLI